MIDGWETIRYPDAELVPWQYQRQDGTPGFYIAANTPIAVVLHTMQGYISTARQWATTGTGRIASWHFSVGRDGSVLQHLNIRDGGFHAGITDRQAATNPPTWPLWKGPGINVNHYCIGIEHEGFSGEPYTEAQAVASRKLCQWLAAALEIPLDREHFPPHADIDTVNRVNDFNTPELRELHYQYLFGEADMPMTPEQLARLERLERIVAANGINIASVGHPPKWIVGEAALAHLEGLGTSAYAGIGDLNAALTEHGDNHPGGFTEDEIGEISVNAVADKLLS